jgi:anti-anti-sigma factor
MGGSESPVRGWSGGAPPPLACEVSVEQSTARVRLTGELDLASAPTVDARLRELVAGGSQELIVDLGGLSFMDSSGLRLLVGWAKAAAAEGIAFSMLPANPSVQRVFSMAGLEDFLPFVPAERSREGAASDEVSTG